MMATVLHVTSSLGHRKFQADGFLLNREYHAQAPNAPTTAVHWVKRPCSQLQLKHTTDIYLHFLNTICKTSTLFQKVVLLSMDPTYYIP